jgi:predicted neutral ceramidase superfamily lipid hydrolase
MAESGETEKERVDRELIELLNEMRVALPGVQVLFAFLLTVPFSQRFGTLDSGQRREYFLAIVLTSLSTAFLIAPSAQHRMRFRQKAKEALVKVGSACTLAGLAFLAAAVGVAMHLVTKLLYDSTVASVVAGLLTGGTAVLWFVVPRFFPDDEEQEEPPRP